ncbi:hypothetical protein BDZ97DRAFT_1834632, partial [Flammula alnicola]
MYACYIVYLRLRRPPTPRFIPLLLYIHTLTYHLPSTFSLLLSAPPTFRHPSPRPPFFPLSLQCSSACLCHWRVLIRRRRWHMSYSALRATRPLLPPPIAACCPATQLAP